MRLKVRHDKKVLLVEHSLFLFGLLCWLVLEVLVFHLNDILTEALALDLVQSSELPLLIPAIIEELLDGHVVLRILPRVRDVFLHTVGLNQLHDALRLCITCIDSFYHRAKRAFAHFFQVDVPL
jgi:hypothetical protein